MKLLFRICYFNLLFNNNMLYLICFNNDNIIHRTVVIDDDYSCIYDAIMF